MRDKNRQHALLCKHTGSDTRNQELSWCQLFDCDNKLCLCGAVRDAKLALSQIYVFREQPTRGIRLRTHIKTPHSSPSRASHGVSLVSILEKSYRVITTPHHRRIPSVCVGLLQIVLVTANKNALWKNCSDSSIYLLCYGISYEWLKPMTGPQDELLTHDKCFTIVRSPRKNWGLVKNGVGIFSRALPGLSNKEPSVYRKRCVEILPNVVGIVFRVSSGCWCPGVRFGTIL